MHGYLSDKNSFFNQLKHFEQFFSVYAFDFKGFGDNKDMPYPYSLDDYILDVKEYFYKNNIVKPSVIAHSFGGRVTLKMAGTDKNVFDKLVLTGCAGLKPRFSMNKFIKKTAFSLCKNFVEREKLTRFYSSDYLALNDVMKKSFVKIIKEHLDYILEKIENPTLVINGDLDKQTPLYMAKKINRKIRNSKLVIIKGAGHFAFIDKPHTFNREVEEFLL